MSNGPALDEYDFTSVDVDNLEVVTDDSGAFDSVVDSGDLLDSLPTGTAVNRSDDVGQCAKCGIAVMRPSGLTPAGRKKRIPKHCDDCKKVPSASTSGNTVRRRRSGIDIQTGMSELYASLGLIALAKDPELGVLILGQDRLTALSNPSGEMNISIADDAGKAWADVAAANPAVNNALEKLLKTGVWGEIFNAHAPLIGLVLQRKPKLGKIRSAIARRRLRKAADNVA